MPSITRRRLLVGAVSTAAAGVIAGNAWQVLRQPRARVAILRARTYDDDLAGLISSGLERFPATLDRVRGARVVLKPNLVEWNPDRPINTDPRLVAAAAEAFLRAGARAVVVAEGPGHRRDTELLVERSGLAEQLARVGVSFVDLNTDDPVEVPLPHDLTGMGRMRLGRTAATADLLVSMPRLKTHHWAGATLSMKNLFGTVPGAVYGWPKNPLHHAGIPASILDLWSALRPGFAIADGIVGMEGDGPLMGRAVPVGAVVMGEQLPAVDATCARLMGLRPERMAWLARSAALGGTVSRHRIAVEGDGVVPVPFEVLPHWSRLRA